MNELDLDDVFNRVHLYLLESGVVMTPDQCARVLQLLQSVVADVQRPGNTATALELAIDALPGVFELPALAVPQISPPLQRGSIGYHAPEARRG